MKLNPQIYLAFDGRCEAAFRFYERCLGGRFVGMFTFAGSPLAGEAPHDVHLYDAKGHHLELNLPDAGTVDIVGGIPAAGPQPGSKKDAAPKGKTPKGAKASAPTASADTSTEGTAYSEW